MVNLRILRIGFCSPGPECHRLSLLNQYIPIVHRRFSTEFYYEIYHEMSIKCHDQNSGHSKNHNEIFMIQYWNIMRLRSGHIMIYCWKSSYSNDEHQWYSDWKIASQLSSSGEKGLNWKQSLLSAINMIKCHGMRYVEMIKNLERTRIASTNFLLVSSFHLICQWQRG